MSRLDTFERYLQLLAEFVAFKTVSTDASYKPDIRNCVGWLHEQFVTHGFDVMIEEPGCNPIVIARKVVDPVKETVLVYGHYDVQPAHIIDGWKSDPFRLYEEEGKWYARGVTDNKGQVLMHMVSVFDLLAQGKLASNVVFVIEGNEETGGSGLAKLLHEKTHLFDCDLVIISDGEIPYAPVVEASFRGVVNVELTLHTAKQSLHSGIYGGAVPSASDEMIKLLGSLKDSNGKVLVPHFYDNDIKVTPQQLAHCAKMDGLRVPCLSHTGVKWHDPHFTAATGFSSMLAVSGVGSGYIGEGFSNIIPHAAKAKINIRLAGKSNPQTIVNELLTFLKSRLPSYVDMEVFVSEMVAPVYLDVNSPLHQSIIALLERVYGKPVTTNYCGGTIPIVSEFVSVLGVELLSIPLGNDDCNMHGANENLDIELAKKGLEFSTRFFSHVD